MRNWYIADTHFGHCNVIRFDGRPFVDVEEMDRVLIENWNARVGDGDDVYVLGDFCYRSARGPVWYLKRLKGRKHLVTGNHDRTLLADTGAMACFESVDKMMFVKEEQGPVCLCHFPIAEWHGFYRNSWHVYGHIHNQRNETYEFMKSRERALNAGCMINNYSPVRFQELVENNRRWRELP